MDKWKCRRCNYESEKTAKRCKRCNYPMHWKKEESNLDKKYHAFNGWEHEIDNDYKDATVTQDGDQFSFADQESDELIWIRESCNVTVQTTDTQAAVSLQVGLQLAIALVISITIGDTDRGRIVAQDIFQKFNDEQTNKQKIFIDNSKDVNIVTTDTDLTVNVQALLQVLVALVVKLDVL